MTTKTETKEKRRLLFVLITTIIGSMVVLLDGTVVNLALPKIGANLHVGFSSLQWIVDGYALSLSALILLGGSLGDILGRKKVYLIGLIGFGLGSLLCAVAPNIGFLIAARIIQGVFGAMLVPGALSIINTNFPREGRGQAIGRWTAWTSIAVVIGPLVGGLILGVAIWRWIFLINIPLAAVCFLIGSKYITESKDEEPRHIDSFGAVLAALALTGLTYGLIQGPANHWNALAIGSLVAGFLLSIGFVLFESRAKDPMVKLDLFKSRNFSGSNIMTFAMYGALSGLVFSLVIYLQTYLGYSSLKAGFSLLPVSIIMFLFAGRVGGLSARFGSRLFMTFGPLIAASGMLYLHFLKPGDSYVTGVLPGALLFACGLVLTVAPLTTTVMSSVANHESGIASGINNAVSRVAGLIVVAVLGLFGAAQVYSFATILAACMAAFAGVTSFLIIRNQPLLSKK